MYTEFYVSDRVMRLCRKSLFIMRSPLLYTRRSGSSRANFPYWGCFVRVQRVEARCKYDCEIKSSTDYGVERM